MDADTAEEVANEDIVKGYKVDTDTFVEVTKEELDNVALQSTQTIAIDEFVDRSEIDSRYPISPCYLRPDAKVGRRRRGHPRNHSGDEQGSGRPRSADQSRAHHRARALGKGLMETLLRYPYKVRSEEEYFDDIQDVKATEDMLDLAKHIVNQKAGRFEPDKFEDHYETALVDFINQQRAGKPITAKERPRRRKRGRSDGALRKRIGGAEPAKDSKSAKKPRKVASGQKEMLMPIAGKKPAKEAAAKKPAAKPERKSA